MRNIILKLAKRFIQFLFPRHLVSCRRNINENKIAITFDDGPHAENTKDILAILREAGVKATFFIVGKEAEVYPHLIESMAQDAHEIANHSYSHLKDDDIEGVERTEDVIRKIAGRSPRFFRPPWGRITLIQLLYSILNEMKIVSWSFDSLDNEIKTPQGLRDYLKRSEIKSGDILLFHEDYQHTVEALPDIIRDLRSRGLSFCTVSDLLR